MNAHVSFKPILTLEEIEICVQIAQRCWQAHYPAIIGQNQVDYMLESLQSAAVINQQIAQGRQYFLICQYERTMGYLALDEIAEHLTVFISKFYVLPESQKSGIGAASLALLHARYPQCIFKLTVNKHNDSAIAFYQAQGFRITVECVTDIGNGFVMDDYEMACFAKERNTQPS